MEFEPRASVEAAYERIRGVVRRTPSEPAPWLSTGGAREVVLKLENLQRTGSFKLRGAASRLTTLDDATRARGIVAASTGNHGAGVACAAAAFGATAIVYAPETADPAKLRGVSELGAEVRRVGTDCLEAEAAARAFAEESGATYVSPYNDPDVVAGQGTVALELLDDAGDDFDALYVAVGGGGLIGGIGAYAKARLPHVEVVGCSPANSAVMAHSLAAGEVLDLESLPTLSDATAGGVERGTITFELCRASVDRFVLVDEDEIARAMRDVIEHEHVLVEGAAGVAVAAFRRDAERLAGKRVAIVLCGANVSRDVLASVLAD